MPVPVRDDGQTLAATLVAFHGWSESSRSRVIRVAREIDQHLMAAVVEITEGAEFSTPSSRMSPSVSGSTLILV
jgi:hypothetical protein